MKLLIAVTIIKDIGGISTSLLNFVKLLRHKYEITICVLGNYVSPNVEIPIDVRIIGGSHVLENIYADRNMLHFQTLPQKAVRNVQRGIRKIIGTPSIIEKEIKKIKINETYDVAIAFMNDQYDTLGRISSGGSYDFVQKYVSAKRKVAWIHNDPVKLGFTSEICKRVFAEYDAVVNVSKDCKTIFDSMIPEYVGKSFVVYNLYDIEAIVTRSEEYQVEKPRGVSFVTVARLYNKQKRIDRIINTASHLKTLGYNNFHFTIVGEGGDRPMLEALIDEKGVHDCVTMTGLKPNPYPYMRAADAFLLTSEYEGFGMTIREAQILKTPVIVTNFGPASEVVIDNKNGLICPNSEEGVFEIIKQIIEKPEILSKIKTNLIANPVDNSVAFEQINQVLKG